MAETEASWFCYMVRCGDGSFYVGIANDVEERIKRHNWGVGPSYTAKRRPVQLVWSECCGDSDAARRREKEIKGWSREKKLELVRKRERQTRAAIGAGKPFARFARAQGKGESSNG